MVSFQRVGSEDFTKKLSWVVKLAGGFFFFPSVFKKALQIKATEKEFAMTFLKEKI